MIVKELDLKMDSVTNKTKKKIFCLRKADWRILMKTMAGTKRFCCVNGCRV